MPLTDFTYMATQRLVNLPGSPYSTGDEFDGSVFESEALARNYLANNLVDITGGGSGFSDFSGDYDPDNEYEVGDMTSAHGQIWFKTLDSPYGPGEASNLSDIPPNPFAAAESTQFARLAASVVTWNNRVYVGYGDWVANTGPCTIAYYDLDTEEWVTDIEVAGQGPINLYLVDNGARLAFVTSQGHGASQTQFGIKDSVGAAWRLSHQAGTLQTDHALGLMERSGVLYINGAQGNNAVIYRSTDWGATWTRVLNLAGVGQYVTFTRIDGIIQTADMLYAAKEGDNYVYSSSDGITWTLIPIITEIPIVGHTDDTVRVGMGGFYELFSRYAMPGVLVDGTWIGVNNSKGLDETRDYIDLADSFLYRWDGTTITLYDKSIELSGRSWLAETGRLTVKPSHIIKGDDDRVYVLYANRHEVGGEFTYWSSVWRLSVDGLEFETLVATTEPTETAGLTQNAPSTANANHGYWTAWEVRNQGGHSLSVANGQAYVGRHDGIVSVGTVSEPTWEAATAPVIPAWPLQSDVSADFYEILDLKRVWLEDSDARLVLMPDQASGAMTSFTEGYWASRWGTTYASTEIGWAALGLYTSVYDEGAKITFYDYTGFGYESYITFAADGDGIDFDTPGLMNFNADLVSLFGAAGIDGTDILTAASDPASTMALANAIRTLLIDLGAAN